MRTIAKRQAGAGDALGSLPFGVDPEWARPHGLRVSVRSADIDRVHLTTIGRLAPQGPDHRLKAENFFKDLDPHALIGLNETAPEVVIAQNMPCGH